MATRSRPNALAYASFFLTRRHYGIGRSRRLTLFRRKVKSEVATLEEMQEQLGESREEFLRLLGLITVNFAGLEFAVQMFIAQLMTAASLHPMTEKDLLVKGSFYLEFAFLITAELPFQKKLTMMESLYKHIERDKKAVTRLTELIRQACTAEQKRNMMVHSSWGGTLGSPHPVRTKTTAKRDKNKQKPSNLNFENERINLKDVAAVADLLWETCRDLEVFMRTRC